GADSARRNPGVGRGAGMKIPLAKIAYTRSGDKGDTANIGVIAYDADVSCVALDRKSTRLNSSHGSISYAVFCLKKKKTTNTMKKTLTSITLKLRPSGAIQRWTKKCSTLSPTALTRRTTTSS